MAEPTFWNGEPCGARRVTLTVADAPEFPRYWAREIVGQERDAVEVTYYADGPFYLDDDMGQGWAKVTTGNGSTRCGHRDLVPVPGSVVERAGADTRKETTP